MLPAFFISEISDDCFRRRTPAPRSLDEIDAGGFEGFSNFLPGFVSASLGSVDGFKSLYRWDGNVSDCGHFLLRPCQHGPRRLDLSY
jgi:hypothetical protein